MRTVIQRVKYADVKVDGKVIGSCREGFMILLGIGREDSEADIEVLVNKISKLRVFEDADGKMNLSIQDIKGEILLISQFTLYAQCRKGNRPSFTDAAPPDIAVPLYESFIEGLRQTGIHTECGQFGADMKVELLNDGPVTIVLDSNGLR